MLYWLTQLLQEQYHAFRVFQYLTFRSILSALTALLLSLFLGPWMMRWLMKMQIGQEVRVDGPKTHLSKSGTPTMGGVLIILSISLSCFLWGNWHSSALWIAWTTLIGFAAIGWMDDYHKVVKKDPNGLRAYKKLLLQSCVAIIVVIFLYIPAVTLEQTQIIVPFLKHSVIQLGWFFPIFAYFVIVGSSNAVNLTDGLDGLAILPIVLVSGALGVFTYASSNSIFAHYLDIIFIPQGGELTIFCSAIVGAGLGFLWYNTYPAQIFMGDVGSLSLGAALGIVAVIIRQELVLLILGGIFVLETISVMLQVGYFKYTKGKRLFKMAPLHHHFELQGWSEPKVIVRFWILTVIFVLCGLASLKLR